LVAVQLNKPLTLQMTCVAAVWRPERNRTSTVTNRHSHEAHRQTAQFREPVRTANTKLLKEKRV